MEQIINIKDLHKHYITGYKDFFHKKPKLLKAVDGVDLCIQKGETLGLVGESGCGKSTLARLITRLESITRGKVFFKDIDITTIDGNELRQIRQSFQIIFQDPFSSLNPRMTVGDIIKEPLIIFNNKGFMSLSKEDISQRTQEVMKVSGLSTEHINRYPHEFSGGQRQRIGIARALILKPELIICDEPVSALDVSIQAQVINLLKELQQKHNLTYLFISHDLSVVKYISDRIAVMYLGRIIELADVNTLYSNPLHPYTQALLAAIPDSSSTDNTRKKAIKGDAAYQAVKENQCRFYARCPIHSDECLKTDPLLEEKDENHFVACIKIS